MKNASIKSLPQLVRKNILLTSAADKVYRNPPSTGALVKTPCGLRGPGSARCSPCSVHLAKQIKRVQVHFALGF